MSLVIWTNFAARPEGREILERELAQGGYRLVQSASSSRSVLAAGQPDPVLGEADVAFGQPDPVDVTRYPRLRWVALSTAGYTRYDRDDFRAAMRARGTRVTNVSAVFSNPCAEHLLAQMLAITRELPKHWRNQAGPRQWIYLESRYTIGTLTGQTVVILGYGAIGRRLAELLAPFRCRVIALRRTPGPEPGVEIVNEAQLSARLGLADHVVNILPDAPGTRQYCGAEFFARLKPGACFYNIGRGSTVGQADLIAALETGRVASAYLDAFDPEPLPPEHPLWTAPNCLVTAHVGGGHREQDENLVRHFLGNLARFEKGAELVDRII